MGNAAVQAILYLLDEGFAGNEEHSLLGNLRGLDASDWGWVPEGGRRSIREVGIHAGVAKILYRDHMFGGGTLSWETELRHPALRGAPEDLVGWLRDAHAALHASVAALSDDDLDKPRSSHWGERFETRWLLSVLIQHDLYHAGEINHVRALRHGNDGWPGQ